VPSTFADRLAHTVLVAHGRLYARTGGRIGHRLLGVPSLLLHTVGAKSGAPRTNSLSYAMDGPRYVVVASAGGSSRNPAWFHNVRANPDVVAQVGTRRVPSTARIVLPDDADYERLWKLVNANNKQRYAAYQRLTSRPIPIVVLSPT
jgi:deazaflavin-dependent oxidoreductase (nitroreductase family)